MMQRKSAMALAAVAAGLAYGGVARALDLQVSSSLDEWKANFRSFNVENFNGLPNDLVSIGDAAGGTLTGPAGFDIVIDRGSPVVATGIQNGLFIGDVHSPFDLDGNAQTDVPQVTSLQFEGQMFGFAATFLSLNTAGIEVMIANETFDLPVGSPSFFGVVSRMPFGFDDVQIRFLGNPAQPRNLNEVFFMDDVHFSASLIPEPLTGGLAMLGLGALGVATTRRRRA